MTSERQQFELTKDIEHYLSALAKLYKMKGAKEKLALLVNARIRVHEAWSYDNWNDGTYGHALYLSIPERLYLNSVEGRHELQNAIREDLNKIHNVQNEFIEQVFLEMERSSDTEWRQESGALLLSNRIVAPGEMERLWEAGCYRVFLSHKAQVKVETAALKNALRPFGITCFVAHQDIKPTKAWQAEIENALVSMDAFVALLTDDFHDSDWTDQEVGFALARGVPMIAVKLGRDPYGFIGKFQALKCNWEEAPVAIARLLIKQPRMLDAYIDSLSRCLSFEEGNKLAGMLGEIDSLSAEQVEKIISTYNADPELRGSFGFNGSKPHTYGRGLAYHLTRITGQNYSRDKSGQISKTTA